MTSRKNFYWNKVFNFATYVFDVYFYDEEGILVYKSYVEHPCERKMHVEAIKKHLLARNWETVRTRDY